jgi:hypothetical protein
MKILPQTHTLTQHCNSCAAESAAVFGPTALRCRLVAQHYCFLYDKNLRKNRLF